MVINSGNNRTRHRNSAISDINITPFVDVLLVLLIIFMVTAPIITGGLNIDLPDGVANSGVANNEPLVVQIAKDGTIAIKESKIDLDSMAYNLHKLTDKDFSIKIHVKADKNNDYGDVMKVVKSINLAGYNQVVLVTEVE